MKGSQHITAELDYKSITKKTSTQIVTLQVYTCSENVATFKENNIVKQDAWDQLAYRAVVHFWGGFLVFGVLRKEEANGQ